MEMKATIIESSEKQFLETVMDQNVNEFENVVQLGGKIKFDVEDQFVTEEEVHMVAKEESTSYLKTMMQLAGCGTVVTQIF